MSETLYPETSEDQDLNASALEELDFTEEEDDDWDREDVEMEIPDSSVRLGLMSHTILEDHIVCHYCAIYQADPESEEGINARNLIIRHNMKLIYSVANKYRRILRGGTLTMDDLIQIGTFGIIEAIKKFNPDYSVKFSTYAFWWIRQAITSHKQRYDSATHVPAYVYDLASKARKQMNNAENLRQLGVTNARANLTLEQQRALNDLEGSWSMDFPIGEDGNKQVTFGEMLPDTKSEQQVSGEFFANEASQLLATVMKKILNERELKVLVLRFGLNDDSPHTLEEISDHLGVTRERVRQIINSALLKLKKSFTDNGLSLESFEDLLG